ncbi:MAG: hypothetical protein NTX53_16905 [candidate division WOR-3 bacterium]|nr:hypothetical protein [candidate division WOR-3 bacterium]
MGPAHAKARHDAVVELVERMLKLHVKNRTLTADSLRLAAPDGCSTRNTSEPLAVNRKPIALPDALVYELYGLTEEEIRIVEGNAK